MPARIGFGGEVVCDRNVLGELRLHLTYATLGNKLIEDRVRGRSQKLLRDFFPGHLGDNLVFRHDFAGFVSMQAGGAVLDHGRREPEEGCCGDDAHPSAQVQLHSSLLVLWL